MAITLKKALNKNIRCGIWAGRFQYVHNGHHYVFSEILSKFSEQIVAIVHPYPYYETRTMQALEKNTFQRFGSELNPFNFFQRMLLWKTIAINEGRTVSIVPCWHPRVSIELENEFLPSSYSEEEPVRCWIVPIGQDDNERRKTLDLEANGEIVCDSYYGSESENLRAISASQVRQFREENAIEEFSKSVPPCIQQLTLDLAEQSDPNEYRVVPLIDDVIDYTSFQYVIDWASEKDNRFVVVAISVGVSITDNSPWWYKSAQRLGSAYTYYQKMKQMEHFFEKMAFARYLITPIFVQERNISRLWSYSSAFLPSKCKWIINSDISYQYGLLEHFHDLPSRCEYINRHSYLLKPENYDLFSKADVIVKQIICADTYAIRHTRSLKSNIENSLPMNATSNPIFCNFVDYPERLAKLIEQWHYNAVSESELIRMVQKMEDEWNSK